MKIPSLEYILNEAKVTFKRFPLVLSDALVGVLIIIYLVEKNSEKNFYLINLLLTTILGLTLFLSVALYSESRQKSQKENAILNIFAFCLLTLYFFLLPQKNVFFEYFSAEKIHFTIFFLALHLLVAFIPFGKNQEVNSLWEYNISLFTRFIKGGIFSVVLFAGLVIALASSQFLFELKLNEKLYFYLWVATVGIFNTWFFLAGVPKEFTSKKEPEVPKDLKTLVRYLLIPIVTLYLIILYLYAGKIVLMMSWPKGGVASLITGCALLGILSLLLIQPLQEKEETKWLKLLAKNFYFLLLPLLIMLFLSLERRIRDYGITENRYFLLVTALWLFAISLYFLLSKRKNIRIIPVSLFYLSLATAFGPWSAINISYQSQFSRLKELLTKNEILQADKIVPVKNKINKNDQREISAIVDYLVNRDRDSELLSLMVEQPEFASSGRWNKSEKILKAMGLRFVRNYRYIQEEMLETENFNFNVSENNSFTEIKDFNYHFKINIWPNNRGSNKDPVSFTGAGIQFQLYYDQKNSTLNLQKNKKDYAVLKLKDFLEKLLKNNENGSSVNLERQELTIEQTSEKLKIILHLSNINGLRKGNQIELNFINGDLFLQEIKKQK